MVVIRPARPADLPAIFAIFSTHEVAGVPDPPPRGAVWPSFAHALATGALAVAEEDGALLGYAGAVARGSVAYLTDLFVRPAAQSAGLGAALLRAVFPPAQPGRRRFTVASTDPRALALYVRAGLTPHWPNLLLRTVAPAPDRLPASDVEVVEAPPDDPELLRWDAELGGRERPEDHAFWVREEGGVPLWFHRGGATVGYGYARTRAPAFWHPEHLRLGPIGARTPEDARACVLAAVRWARPRSAVLRLDIPGPHPALPALLNAHCRIVYVETFLADAPPFDPRRYLGSGDALF